MLAAAKVAAAARRQRVFKRGMDFAKSEIGFRQISLTLPQKSHPEADSGVNRRELR